MKNTHNMEMFYAYPDVLTVREARDALRIGRASIYQLLASGKLGYFKVGNTYKIPKTALIDYMNRETDGGERK